MEGIDSRSVARFVIACVAVGAALVGAETAAAKDPPPRAPAPHLRDVPIRDVPTTVSVPLPEGKSLVVGLPERFWIQCPRHSAVETIATSLAGDGLVLTFMNVRGGSHSLFYVGAVPLAPPLEPEKLETRVEKAARDFVADLRAKYATVDFALKDARVTVEKATVVVGGKKQAAWRTSRHVTLPAGPVSGPDAVFAGECVLFCPEGTESLVYLSLTSKSGGTSLDKVLGDLSVKPTAEFAAASRVVQLNDISLAKGDAFFPVRLVSYASPTGFAPTLEVVRMRANLVYAEDRVDEAKVVTGALRFDEEDADSAESLEKAATRARDAVPWGKPSGLVEVPLATEGARAMVFRYAGSDGGRSSTVQTAIVLLDDKVLKVTWATYGDAALAEKDAAAFDRMLRSMQTAIRSQP